MKYSINGMKFFFYKSQNRQVSRKPLYWKQQYYKSLKDTKEQIWIVMDWSIHFWVNNLNYDRIRTREPIDWLLMISKGWDDVFFVKRCVCFKLMQIWAWQHTFCKYNWNFLKVSHFVNNVNNIFWEIIFFSKWHITLRNVIILLQFKI